MKKFDQEFKFGTKSETLWNLKDLVTECSVPKFMYFNIAEWTENKSIILDRVVKNLDSKYLVVRSSAKREDDGGAAMAGAFLSIGYIDSRSSKAIEEAIEEVISSYDRDGVVAQGDDQVLIQEMLTNVAMSGVVFTQEINSGAPYYIVNYDDESGRTDTITSGTDYINRTLQLHRNEWKKLGSPRFKSLLKAVEEIERLTENSKLDIEFTLDPDNRVFLLQVRQITTTKNWSRDLTLRMNDMLARVEETLNTRLRPLSGVVGERSIFGKMPDWNPAEMIGSTPRKLAFSLYRLLITDETWRKARSLMGYAEPRGWPLMSSFGGQPYIDVRLSFHSYLPKDLPCSISHKIVNAWLDKLKNNPHFHDKIEFEVATTCFSFDLDSHFDEMYSGCLDKQEVQIYRDSLQRLTHKLLSGQVSSISDNLALLDVLQERRIALLDEYDEPNIALVRGLIEDCIEYGTMPFSVLARHGFIANSMLLSLISEGVLSRDEVVDIQSSISTVASEFLGDMELFYRDEIHYDKLMEKYGHLRPGTYDILSPRYDKRDNLFSKSSNIKKPLEHKKEYKLDDDQKKAIKLKLDKIGYVDISSDHLLEYIVNAIKGREYAKFVFTRNVSDLLEVLSLWGKRVGLTKDELSFLSINDILDCMVNADGRSLESHLKNMAEAGRRDHEVTSALHLPMLITQASDLYIVPLRIEQPNFITRNCVQAECILVSGDMSDPELLDNKIVLIEGADPGFDWIFGRAIQGLITKYGGANSHMAIRCAELGMPAAIGCGEQIFDRLIQGSNIVLNCAEGRVFPDNAG